MKMEKGKELKCEICGLVIDDDRPEILKKKYYHSKCLSEAIRRERQAHDRKDKSRA